MQNKSNPQSTNRQSDLTGMRFGRLLVQGIGVRPEKARESYWSCLCDCGSLKNVARCHLLYGTTKSCGCLGREKSAENGKNNTKHGLCYSVEYHAHENMLVRCYNHSHKAYPRYGGRGIRVCDSWKNSFEAFYSDMGPRPSDGHSLDRIDNDKDYTCGKCHDCIENGSPANCRWATRKEQTRNRRSNRIIEYQGESKTVAEWAEIFGISYECFKQRLNRGWSFERATKVTG